MPEDPFVTQVMASSVVYSSGGLVQAMCTPVGRVDIRFATVLAISQGLRGCMPLNVRHIEVFVEDLADARRILHTDRHSAQGISAQIGETLMDWLGRHPHHDITFVRSPQIRETYEAAIEVALPQYSSEDGRDSISAGFLQDYIVSVARDVMPGTLVPGNRGKEFLDLHDLDGKALRPCSGGNTSWIEMSGNDPVMMARIVRIIT